MKKIRHWWVLSIICLVLVTSMAGQHLSEPSLKNAKTYYINTAETDQCRHAPGDTVRFRLNLNSVPVGVQLKIQYFIEGRLLTDETIPLNKRKSVEWNWLPPATDFRGYLVGITIQQSQQILDRTTIAVDVSSDWKMFPRYGFVSAYSIMSDEEIHKVIARLNRLHINGVQFYDWHNSHHKPLKIDSTGVAVKWNDIASRINYRETIEKYLATAHEFGMTCMAYNLICGAWTSGFQEGVSPEWGLYKDAAHQNPFALRLPAGWASDIYFMSPANSAWREYILSSTAAVFEALDFDGWHVDQIGDLGVLYTFDGQPLELKTTYRPFLQAAEDRLKKKIVMNAVGNYAQAEISQAPVEFLYTEIWNPDSTFNDLVRVMDYNYQVSGRHNTILAAYMNYNRSSRPGIFNTPGVLLTDAVIFANGGAHLEMGDHMLCHEYFPNANLAIDPGLDSALTRYYDFSVAYENLLRNPALQKTTLKLEAPNYSLSSRAEKGQLWTITNQLDNRDIIHLINLQDVKNLNWRDPEGNCPEPLLCKDIEMTMRSGKKVQSIILTSPDWEGGRPIPVKFKQKKDLIAFTIPQLKYWDMLIVEYR